MQLQELQNCGEQSSNQQQVFSVAMNSYLGSHEALLGVEVGRRLVDEVDVCRLAEAQCHGDALQLTAGHVLDFLRKNQGNNFILANVVSLS